MEFEWLLLSFIIRLVKYKFRGIPLRLNIDFVLANMLFTPPHKVYLWKMQF